MLLLMFVAIGGCAGTGLGLIAMGRLDVAWYFALATILLCGLLLNETTDNDGGARP